MLQRQGVRVAPYINGRIFDKATASWTAHGGTAAHAAAKRAVSASLGTPVLSTYDESYGSHADFAVMCPHTSYWQQTITDVVGTLVKGYGLDGVYIDQIAAAGPRPCWDPSHGHPVGGGAHWVGGYRQMLEAVRQRVGTPHVILTESNSEPFMDGVQLFLTLVGFKRGDPPSSPSPRSARTIVPAFQAIYGGYVLPVGSEFFQQDLVPDPDVFASKLATQFGFGAQMGWFSLGGRDNQQPPMGLFELLMSPAFDAEIDYLRTLSRGKQLAADWFNFGRAMRPLPVLVNATSVEGVPMGADADAGVARHPMHPRSSSDAADVGLAFGDVMSSAWFAANESSLLATLSTVKRSTPAGVHCLLDVREYGFAAARADDLFRVLYLAVEPDAPGVAWQTIGIYPAAAVRLNVTLGVRALVLMRIEAELLPFAHA